MESNQNTEKASKAKTKYRKDCKATYSLQLFNIGGCNMEECRFCYSNHESAAIIENQSRKIQELNRQLELSRQLEFNSQIELLAGRLATIETNQNQNYKHELRHQSSETHLDSHLPTNNELQHIKIIAERSNFHLKTKNRFNALKDEMENNINSTKEQTT
ncbi:hypothetical protein FHG87_012395 [Trinorchestia longiramus]|nr:hypothetical protein FHG87_012395 [Trinorchestia longiramus]